MLLLTIREARDRHCNPMKDAAAKFCRILAEPEFERKRKQTLSRAYPCVGQHQLCYTGTRLLACQLSKAHPEEDPEEDSLK